ncbi:4'-phosphopantetheinyl transferase superfamily protein [Streptomyces sp. NPDC059788]|uniref:4'-phosphopantetheinyl transferase superfamily protein n=1 Tax=Streptomyces sp. NPDC059788 TaxID=3346948 RepID=UPI00364FAD02
MRSADRAPGVGALLALRPVLARQGIALGIATAEDRSAHPAGPGEAALADAMFPVRRRDFLAGRCAARRALAAMGQPAAEILYTGARPRFPVGCVGSISHSRGLAVALSAPERRFRAVGCDLELRGLPLEAAHLVLTADERRRVDDATHPEEAASRLLAAFSAKETAFKAYTALLPAASAPAALLDIAVRPLPGGFRCRLRGMSGHALDVQVRRIGPGVLSWAAAPAERLR